jgi:hypothetical protein
MGTACLRGEAKYLDSSPSPLPFAAHDETGFVNDESLYDPKPFAELVRFILLVHMPKELIAIILEGTADIRHTWTPLAGPRLDCILIEGNRVRCRD